jgi:hypothetical protein
MDLILNTNSQILCTASGTLAPQIQNPRVVATRVLVVGNPILTEVDLFPVTACKPPGTMPVCTPNWRWLITALRVTVGGKRVLHETSIGMCPISAHFTASITAVQTRVKGT